MAEGRGRHDWEIATHVLANLHNQNAAAHQRVTPWFLNPFNPVGAYAKRTKPKQSNVIASLRDIHFRQQAENNRGHVPLLQPGQLTVADVMQGMSRGR